MNPRQLATLFGCLFLIGSAEVVAGPMMASMGRHFGVPSSTIAYLPAAYGLTYGGIALFVGPLSDRFGRKRPLQLGLLGFAILSALIPVAPSLGAGIALSALTGLCAAIIQPNALSLVADLSPSDQIGRRIGHVFIGLMLAFVLTPALAGKLADTSGWTSAYYALSALALVAFSAASTTFERDGQANATGAGGLSIFLATHHGALATPDVRWRLSASYLWLGWVAGFGAVVAEVASRKLTMTTTQAGLLAGFFGLMVIAGNLCNGRIQRVIGNAALPVTALASALGVLLFLLPISSPVQLGLIGIPWAFGYGCAGPLHHARLSALSDRYRGTINSYHASLLNLGIFSVSALMGALVPIASLSTFCAAVGGVALAGSALLWRKNQPKPNPATATAV
jgi:predicted MFS family arabinose efflux permease